MVLEELETITLQPLIWEELVVLEELLDAVVSEVKQRNEIQINFQAVQAALAEAAVQGLVQVAAVAEEGQPLLMETDKIADLVLEVAEEQADILLENEICLERVEALVLKVQQ